MPPFAAWCFVEALWKAEVHHTLRFDCLEPHYNLAHRVEFERELKTICQYYQVREEAWRVFAEVEQIAQGSGSTPNAIALAWLLAQSVVTTPILGARSVPQLEACLDALEMALTPDQLARRGTASAWEAGG